MTDIIARPFHQFPAEGASIGRILVYYGELEWFLAKLTGAALEGALVAALRTFYRIRSESGRIKIADALARFAYDRAGLIDDYIYALNLLRHALKIRNQYSHCVWGTSDRAWGPYNGALSLRFLNLEDEATKAEGFWDRPSEWEPWQNVDAKLLNEQEAHFALTAEWRNFVAESLLLAKGAVPKERAVRPPKRPLPNLYIPQNQSPDPSPNANPSAPQE